MNLPDTVSENVRRKLLLRSANIQRGNGYSTDADRYVVISDWKEIYTELRRCGVEVIEFGLEGDDEIRESEQIKGRKTRELVAEKVGLSPAQVGKFERVDNQGVDELKEALKEDKINVATAAEVASMNPQDQKKILEKSERQGRLHQIIRSMEKILKRRKKYWTIPKSQKRKL